MKKLFVSLSMIALLISSCKKDKDEVAADVTPTKENLTGSYKIIKVMAVASTGQETEMAGYYDACEMDDIHKLNADDTYLIEDQGQECGTADSDEWHLHSSSSIEIYGNTYSITKFDGDKLHLTIDFGSFGKFTEIWDKQ